MGKESSGGTAPTNVVNPRSRGLLSVAVLGGPEFDVDDVDVSTLRFGPKGAVAMRGESLRDVNLDAYLDLMLRFRIPETGIECGDSSVTLSGETLDNRPFEGEDSIRTVGCAGQ
jgi:hypothetical protein